MSEWKSVLEAISSIVARAPKTQFPLSCGCTGPKYISMCGVHQALERDKQAAALLRAEKER